MGEAVSRIPSSADGGSGSGFGWILASVVGLGFLASQCDTEDTGQYSSNSAPTTAEGWSEPETPAQAIEEPPEIQGATTRRAARHLRLALDAEGFAGAMIYSQNCFASVARQFNWPKLDQCGSFDALAQISAGELSFSPEASYFDQTATQQRYLAAAAPSGARREAIESHFELVQAAALERIPDLQTPVPPRSADAFSNTVTDQAVDELNPETSDNTSPDDSEITENDIIANADALSE